MAVAHVVELSSHTWSIWPGGRCESVRVELARSTGLPGYAMRAHYFGGPWGHGYTGWTDYAAGNGTSRVRGSLVKTATASCIYANEARERRWAAFIKQLIALSYAALAVRGEYHVF